MMKAKDVHLRDRLIGLELPMPEEMVLPFIKSLSGSAFDEELLAMTIQDELPRKKYDWLLGPELLAVQQAREFIDVSAAMRTLTDVVCSEQVTRSSQAVSALVLSNPMARASP
jgi:hypothetical protein